MLALPDPELIPVANGELSYWRTFLGGEQASRLCRQLMADVAWQQTVLKFGGRRIPIPRLNAWYGDPGAFYRYSGASLTHNDWLPELTALKEKVQEKTGHRFNSCLVNCYRDGRDSVDWHSDDEPELGENPVVASVSLGAERRFQLRSRLREQNRGGRPIKNLDLQNGSLLLMSGALQHHWQHRLPKEKELREVRINITFRLVTTPYNQAVY